MYFGPEWTQRHDKNQATFATVALVKNGNKWQRNRTWTIAKSNQRDSIGEREGGGEREMKLGQEERIGQHGRAHLYPPPPPHILLDREWEGMLV